MEAWRRAEGLREAAAERGDFESQRMTDAELLNRELERVLAERAALVKGVTLLRDVAKAAARLPLGPAKRAQTLDLRALGARALVDVPDPFVGIALTKEARNEE